MVRNLHETDLQQIYLNSKPKLFSLYLNVTFLLRHAK